MSERLAHDSPRWTDAELLNPEGAGLGDGEEAKLASFLRLLVAEGLLTLRDGGSSSLTITPWSGRG